MAFCSTPCLNTHKIGLIYVGKGQSRQEEILANVDGSTKFVRLLSALGDFVRLSECRKRGWYTGGLDCDTGSDGEFGLFWKDDGCQVVFHVPIMQSTTTSATTTPTATATAATATATPSAAVSTRPRGTIPSVPLSPSTPLNKKERSAVHNKKRHIGNDYVHIVYSDNEDALLYPYRQDTITGQFNFVHIVIRPSGDDYYSIEVKTKEELREVGLFPSLQVIHEKYLATIVREMALSADLACKVYHGQGLYYQDNKLERLNQIQRIRDRLVKDRR